MHVQSWLAHFSGLDEYRLGFDHVGDDGYRFWDDVALGQEWIHQPGDPDYVQSPPSEPPES